MNNLIAIALTSLLFILSGYNFASLLPLKDRVERISLAFLLGSGLTTLLWFIGYRLGLPLNISTLILTGIFLALAGYTSRLLFGKLLVENTPLQFSQFERYFAIIIIILLSSAFIIGNYHPLTAWDSIALYDFRGHAIATNHSLKDIVDLAYYVSYPLMISLVHSIVYMFGGVSAQGIHSLFLVAFLGIVYGRVRYWTNSKYALIACLLVVTQSEIFNHSTFAYTNLPYLVFLVSGYLYAIFAQDKRDNSQFFILFSGILTGLSTWVRSSEIFWVLGIILIIWQGIKQKYIITTISSVLIIFLVRYSWSSFVSQVLLSIGQVDPPRISYLTLDALQLIMTNTISIAKYVYWNIYLPYIGMWFLVIPMIIVALYTRNRKIIMFTTTIAFTACMTIIGIMIFSTYFTTWNQIGDSARRMILFVNPLSLIASVYTLYIMDKKGRL